MTEVETTLHRNHARPKGATIVQGKKKVASNPSVPSATNKKPALNTKVNDPKRPGTIKSASPAFAVAIPCLQKHKLPSFKRISKVEPVEEKVEVKSPVEESFSRESSALTELEETSDEEPLASQAMPLRPTISQSTSVDTFDRFRCVLSNFQSLNFV